MTTSSDRLSGVQLKIDRAKKHISDIVLASDVFTEANRNAFRVDSDGDTGEEVYRVAFRVQIPNDLPLVIGDAIHNLRSALDHLAWQLVEANGSTPGRNTSFPIFDNASAFNSKSDRAIEGMSSAAVQLIEAVQPYQTGYDSIGKLHELDNFDKHRLLVVVAYKLSDIGFGVPGLTQAALQHLFENGLTSSISFAVPGGIAGAQSILKDGDELCRVVKTLHAKPHVEFTAQIAFSEPRSVECKPVVKFLSELAKLVEGAVNQFARII